MLSLKPAISYKNLEFYRLCIMSYILQAVVNLYNKTPPQIHPLRIPSSKRSREKKNNQQTSCTSFFWVYQAKICEPKSFFRAQGIPVETYGLTLHVTHSVFQGWTRCGYIELLLVLACWEPKLSDGRRSSACAKEPLDGTFTSRSWSELSSTKLRASSRKELPSGGKANRLLGLKQVPSFSTTSFFS